MNIDIHIIIDMNNNFGVGDHFQVLRMFYSNYRKKVLHVSAGFEVLPAFGLPADVAGFWPNIRCGRISVWFWAEGLAELMPAYCCVPQDNTCWLLCVVSCDVCVDCLFQFGSALFGYCG